MRTRTIIFVSFLPLARCRGPYFGQKLLSSPLSILLPLLNPTFFLILACRHFLEASLFRAFCLHFPCLPFIFPLFSSFLFLSHCPLFIFDMPDILLHLGLLLKWAYFPIYTPLLRRCLLQTENIYLLSGSIHLPPDYQVHQLTLSLNQIYQEQIFIHNTDREHLLGNFTSQL
jgi:hypothetical protein